MQQDLGGGAGEDRVSICGFTNLPAGLNVSLTVRQPLHGGRVQTAAAWAAEKNKEIAGMRTDPQWSELAPEGDAQPLDGFGSDAALSFTFDAFTVFVIVYKEGSNNVQLETSVSTSDAARALAVAKTLAQKAARRIS